MTLQQLSYAIAISEAGSLNKASEVLYVSQPSLTESLKELEKELGITIFIEAAEASPLHLKDLTSFFMQDRSLMTIPNSLNALTVRKTLKRSSVFQPSTILSLLRLSSSL